MDFKKELSQKVSALTGSVLVEENVFQDNCGAFHNFVRNLQSGYPVVLVCDCKEHQIALVLPETDYGLLETGVRTVDEYIKDSHWSFGRYWGGYHLLNGIYWMPLETGTGITDTERVSRYIRMTICRTAFRKMNQHPTPEACRECHIDSTGCPCSPHNETGSWDKEPEKLDGRLELFRALSERVKTDIGFTVREDALYIHDGAVDEAYLLPNCLPNKVDLCLSSKLLNALLCVPDEHSDWKDMASAFTFVAAKRHWPRGTLICQPISKDNPWPAGTCLEHWGEEALETWHQPEKAPQRAERMRDIVRFKFVPVSAPNLLQRAGDLLSTLFGKK